MTNAFDLAEAASSALADIDTETANEAQRDLLKYMFNRAVEHPSSAPTHFSKVVKTYRAILDFKKSENGNPQHKPEGGLPPDDVIVYCDYSRFDENQNCDGNKQRGWACDRDTRVTKQMNGDYLGCQNTINTDTTAVYQLFTDG